MVIHKGSHTASIDCDRCGDSIDAMPIRMLTDDIASEWWRLYRDLNGDIKCTKCRERRERLYARDNTRKNIHDTQKPVGLLEYLIKTYTNEGDTVLDNTIGSGTTAVAAFNIGRKWIGNENIQKFLTQLVSELNERQSNKICLT